MNQAEKMSLEKMALDGEGRRHQCAGEDQGACQARNEMGQIAGKAVNTQIRTISPAYQQLYDLLASQPFLDLMSQISGIPDLLLDPKMFGGGTHYDWLTYTALLGSFALGGVVGAIIGVVITGPQVLLLTAMISFGATIFTFTHTERNSLLG